MHTLLGFRSAFLLTLPLLGLCSSLYLPAVVEAQGTRADYERSAKLRSLTDETVIKTKIEPNWYADNQRFWYRNDLADGNREFINVDVAAGKRETALDHARLAKALAESTQEEVQADKLPIDWIVYDAESFTVSVKGKGWQVQTQDYSIASVDDPKRLPANKFKREHTRSSGFAQARDVSPDKTYKTFSRDHNLWLREEQGGEEHQLTTDGEDGKDYRDGVFWSPDSSHFIALKHYRGQDHIINWVESSPQDQVQPKLHAQNYIKPGDKITQHKPHLFEVASRKEIPVDDKFFSNPYQMDGHRWSADSRRFSFYYNQRGHQVVRIVVIDGTTGETAALVNEESKTFVDYAFKQFAYYLDDQHEIVWMSERDGWNHLYLYDSRTGDVKNQITKGTWIVNKVEHIDESKRQIWFKASGIYPEQDPYYIHHCRIDMDGSNFTVLTSGNGTHKIQPSPDGKFFIDTYSRVDLPPQHELRNSADGKLVCKLEQADWTALLNTGWQVPERFVAKARDGKTDIYGVIWRPTNFDPKKTYPIIEKIYAGPHGSFVPKHFYQHFRVQDLAEIGFIVVQMDGLGTSNRNKAFHDVCWKNLGDSGFPDRILWIKEAAKKYPYMDVKRVGIFGGSAGGQSSTRALLAHGDFYKVAVSDCGCHDNRMDKIWWNELWMSWPIGPHYAEQSNVTNAHKLEGKLLLTVGELDRNVDPASTMQVVDALIRADKDFDLIVFPGGGHGVGDSPYGVRRRRDFFVRHLLGVEPRAN
ncbi:MAG: dipeptidyl-peptidase-4 [Pirellulaceae bacterium]|jgi:dipeptidyl-peptidase-4